MLQGRGNLRRLGLVTFLLPSPAGYTTRLGSSLGDFDLSVGAWKWVFARSPTFPWNRGGNTRGPGIVIPRIRWLDLL